MVRACVADPIAILMLAAGSSSRMRGRDKLMELVDGQPLLRRQVLRALPTGCRVYVTLPAAPHARYAALEGLDCTAISVPDAREGMNASLSAGLRALPAETQAVMVLLADMPDIDESDLGDTLRRVEPASQTLIWRATTQDGRAGHPIVFHKSLIPALMELSGDQGGSAVVRAHRDRTTLFALPANHARTDLDTPEAWAAWRAANAAT